METDPIGAHIVLQLILLGWTALMQAAESALKAMKPAKLRREAEESSRSYDHIETLLSDFGRTPSSLEAGMTVLTGLVLFSALRSHGAWLGGLFNKAKGVNSASFWSGLLVMAAVLLIVMLFARALPARLARRAPEKTARRLMDFAFLMMRLFTPLSRLLCCAAGGIARLFGSDETVEETSVTEDEIRMMVDAGEEKGAIEESERDMIENVFEFNNMTAEECMTHRTDMSAIWVEDTDRDILQLIEETGLSRFPVYTEDLDHIIGVLTTRDYLMNRIKPEPLPLEKLLRPARFVPESIRTDVLFRNMQRDKIHMAVVVDEYGGTGGLITMEDLLEEIVGNIYDEYDVQEPDEIEARGRNVWRVSGGTEIERFNEETGLSLPLDEEYDTVGGLVLNRLGSVPDDGTTPQVEYEGLIFRVEEVADRRIEWVEVKKEND